MRRCSKTACGKSAVATLTYVYADKTAVLGRLATYAEPHTYDLCADHANRLTAPQGWEVVRLLPSDLPATAETDDLLAVAQALWATRIPHTPTEQPPLPIDDPSDGHRKGHLRILRDS
jgi:uncharacterized protein DUF3499